MEMDAARKHNDNWIWQAWKLLEPVKFVGSNFALWFILADRAVFRVLSLLFGRGALCWSDHPNINTQMHYWMKLCASLYVVWHQKAKVGWSCTNQVVDINTFCCVWDPVSWGSAHSPWALWGCGNVAAEHFSFLCCERPQTNTVDGNSQNRSDISRS